MLARVVGEPEKLAIYRYLEAIAGADGEVSADEAAMLQRVRLKLAIQPESRAG